MNDEEWEQFKEDERRFEAREAAEDAMIEEFLASYERLELIHEFIADCASNDYDDWILDKVDELAERFVESNIDDYNDWVKERAAEFYENNH
jgi:vacuolar-type H+-ATPase catalytic subunit A/Vma1